MRDSPGPQNVTEIVHDLTRRGGPGVRVLIRQANYPLMGYQCNTPAQISTRRGVENASRNISIAAANSSDSVSDNDWEERKIDIKWCSIA